jgi:Skp family chaperone for outer membrane proteins
MRWPIREEERAKLPREHTCQGLALVSMHSMSRCEKSAYDAHAHGGTYEAEADKKREEADKKQEEADRKKAEAEAKKQEEADKRKEAADKKKDDDAKHGKGKEH